MACTFKRERERERKRERERACTRAHLVGGHEFNCCVPIVVFYGERERESVCFMAVLYVWTQLYLHSNMNVCRRIGISPLRHIFKDTTSVKPVHAVYGTP